MIKGMNKITSLLVAAAAVASIVPATSVEAAVRLENKEGTIKQGIAFDDGKYSYYGYKTDADLTGVYSNNGADAKETLSEDLEDYRLNTLSKYGTKYAYAYEQSNADEYLVDLSTGKVVDDETKEEKLDTAQSTLLSKIKKADRYNSEKISNFEQILQGQFGEVWYKYAVDGDKVSDTDVAVAPAKIAVKILTKEQFDAKVNASTVGVGFTGDVAGQAFAFVANGTKVDKTQAAQMVVAYYVDGAGVNQAFNPSGVTVNQATTGASATALTYTATGLAGGTLKTALDNVVAEYDAYLKNNLLTSAPVVGDAVYAKSSVGTAYYLNNASDNVEKTAFIAKVAQINAKANSILSDAQTVYNSAGTSIVTSYADYVTFATNTVNAKLVKANAAKAGFATTINAIQPTDSEIVLTSSVDGPIDLESVKAGLVNVFGSALVDGNDAGVKSEYEKLYGFTNDEGQYIDASIIANMNVYSVSKGRAVNVEQFSDEVNDAGLKVDLVSIDAIAQDKDYIYAITKVKVAGSVSEDQAFIQKISKAQGTKSEDGAYTPKSVTSYQLNTGIYDNDDATDAVGLFDGTNKEYKYLLGITVKGGNTIYVTRANEDEVKVYKVDLDASAKADVLSEGATLKKDVDTTLVTLSDDATEKITKFGTSDSADDEGLQGITAIRISNESNSDEVQLNGETLYKHPSVSIDVNGNTWALKKGKLTKFDGITKNSDIYTIDGAMNAIDVYNDENLIAWDTDGDIYTTIAEGKEQTGDNTTPDPTPVKKGWDKQADGSWKYFGEDGKELTGWQKVGGVWYYIDAASKLMKTGWINDNGTWYYLQSSGAMKTGWLNDNGTWYFLQGSGAMKTGWLNDNGTWYYLNGSGAMKTGWLNDNGTWYYLNGSGAMLSNTTVGGYRLGASGAWVK